MKELKMCNTICYQTERKCEECNIHEIIKPTRDEIMRLIKGKCNKMVKTV